MEKKNSPKDTSGSTTSSSGKTITSKEKAKWDVIIQEAEKERKVKSYDERRDKEKKEKLERSQKLTSEFDTKKSRESLLRNRSFLTSTHKTDVKHIADKKVAIERAVIETGLTDLANKQEAAIKQEQKQTTIDLSTGPFIAPATTGEIKFTVGERLKSLATYLGKSAPMVRHALYAAKQIDPKGELLSESEPEIVKKTFKPK